MKGEDHLQPPGRDETHQRVNGGAVGSRPAERVAQVLQVAVQLYETVVADIVAAIALNELRFRRK